MLYKNGNVNKLLLLLLLLLLLSLQQNVANLLMNCQKSLWCMRERKTTINKMGLCHVGVKRSLNKPFLHV